MPPPSPICTPWWFGGARSSSAPNTPFTRFWPKPQWPYHGLTDRFFTPFLKWDVSDHTTDLVCETGIWSLTSQSEISLKKRPLWQTLVWPLTFKKSGLWDRGMVSDIRIQTMIEKKTLVWQTVVWSLTLQKPGLSDQGVANGVAKFRMAFGRLRENCFPLTENNLP